MNETFLYYNFPGSDNGYKLPFSSKKEEEIRTQLPKNIAIIRAVGATAFSLLIASQFSSPIFRWPLCVAGVAFSGWTVYSHLGSKDPLMEAFHTICGGKEKFEQLPEVHLDVNPGEKIFESIQRLNWNDLEHPIARAKTLDMRNIIIVKGRDRMDANCQTEDILAFIERVGPNDVPREISNVSELAASILHAILLLDSGNTFGSCLRSFRFVSSNRNESARCDIYESISPKKADEFYIQMREDHLR